MEKLFKRSADMRSVSAKQKFAYSLYDAEFDNFDLSEYISHILQIPGIEDRILGARCDAMRVEEVMKRLNTSHFKQQVETLDTTFRKDDTLASILLKKGTALVRDKDQSLRYFGLALLCAPSNGTQIGEIYAKRGLSFLSLMDSEASLKDITRALSCELPTKLRDMMIVVKDRICRQRSQENHPVKSEDIRRKKYLDEVVFHTQGPRNPKAPVAPTYIKPRFIEKKGRCVVTTVDLKPGTTVIVEDPYVAILSHVLKMDTDHCATCFKREECLIPCPNCMFTMYCCEECRMEDFNKGHKYECPCMPVIHSCELSITFHMGFRAVCKAGPQALHKLFLEGKEGRSPRIRGSIIGVNPDTGVYENSYYQITQLIAHEDKEEIPYFACLATLLAQTLLLKTDFFNVADEYCPGTEMAFLIFVASHLIHHGSSFPVNAFGLGDGKVKKCRPATTVPSGKTRVNGWRYTTSNDCTSAVYVFISLISHSCYPNALFDHLPNGKMAIITNREIPAGDEITISYGYYFTLEEIFSRRAALYKSYRFCCLCLACYCAFPLYLAETIDPAKYEFLCQGCRKDFTDFEIIRDRKCVLVLGPDKKTLICNNCKAKTPLKKKVAEASKNDKAFRKVRRLVKFEKNPVDALPILHECLLYYSRNFCPPMHKLVSGVSVMERTMKMLQEKV